MMSMATSQGPNTWQRFTSASPLRRVFGRMIGAVLRVNRTSATVLGALRRAAGIHLTADGPLTWIRTFDGYRLAGSYLPA